MAVALLRFPSGVQRLLVRAFCIWAMVPLPAAADELPQVSLRYAIETKLDTEQHVLTGRERIHFENRARAPVQALYFHLYPNAFRDRNSVFMREGGSGLRNSALRKPGVMQISRLHVAELGDLLASAETELVPGDFTQLRVALPRALQPGAAVDIDIDFRVQLPQIVARAGYVREFHLIGQWFPKLAQLGDDGAFISFPYHGYGEFFADFADYTWSVTLPARYEVAANGVREASEIVGGMRTEHFSARAVHDIVWAADPYFVMQSAQVGGVKVRVFGPRGYSAAIARQLAVVSAALPYFERRYGAYPYPELTVIIPPASAGAAAGKEYPTLFTTAGAFWALPASLPDPMHDVVSVHELAHQWFSGMLASNEVAHPMLDEGLAQWSSLDFLRTYYRRPASALSSLARQYGPFEIMRAMFAWRTRAVPSSLLAADQYNADTLGAAVYVRPSLVLEDIAVRFGRPQLEAALSRYARGARFTHPTPETLYAAFDQTLGSGFSARVLRPALEGEKPRELEQKPAGGAGPGGVTLLGELMFVAQSLLQGLGP